MNDSVLLNTIVRKFKNFEFVNDIQVNDLALSFLIATTRKKLDPNTLLYVVVSDHQKADFLTRQVSALINNSVYLLPAWEIMPGELLSPQLSTMAQRLKVFNKIISKQPELTVIMPVKSAVQLITDDIYKKTPLIIKKGQNLESDQVFNWLVNAGYQREFHAEHEGQFAFRGSIIDIYPSIDDFPYRINLVYDAIESIKHYNPDNQLSFENLNECVICPIREISPFEQKNITKLKEISSFRTYLEQIDTSFYFEGMESLIPWTNKNTFLVTALTNQDTFWIIADLKECKIESLNILSSQRQVADLISLKPKQRKELYVNFEEFLNQTSQNLITEPKGTRYSLFNAQEFPKLISSKISHFIKELKNKGFLIILTSNDKKSLENFKLLFDAAPLNPNVASGIFFTQSELEKGAIFQDVKLAIITENDLSAKQKITRPKLTSSKSANLFEALFINSFVVHKNYGIGIYKGVTKLKTNNFEKEYLLIEYKDGDKLYVPFEQISMLTPYRGSQRPVVTKLGTSSWTLTTKKVKREIAKLALDLIDLYSQRNVQKGFAFDISLPWITEISDSFEFQETPDQKRAIDETLNDMASPKPMDRLIIGDVGFGKTEVAIRAAFIAVLNNKQVLLLCPTTVLAKQHYEVFSARLNSFGIKVGLLSSHTNLAQTKELKELIKNNKIDVLISTHKAIAQNIEFYDLGLLILDEEQRFGVNHKEYFKKIKPNIDVLTLSANPIPRTLELSLTGIRDFSLINTPPALRHPVLTYVGPFNKELIIRAIKKELLRGGQVFYVHNKINDIEKVVAQLSERLPKASIVVAHGRSNKTHLENVMQGFYEGKYQVLVSTTIVESGLDISNANTLIVDDADLLGLGQLHQLRGRVGRSHIQAYAYFFYPQDKPISKTAYSRLKTVSEQYELGSGFRLALRDLELRGAGTLLGKIQSGHLSKVGYDLYVEMVTEAVNAIKGKPIKEDPSIKLLIDASAYLPSFYIQDETTRIEFYRRLSSADDFTEIDEIEAELVDRFGQLPQQAIDLLNIAKIKNIAVRLKLHEIVLRNNQQAFNSTSYEIEAKVSPLILSVKQLKALNLKVIKYNEKEKSLKFLVNSQNPPKGLLDALLTIHNSISNQLNHLNK